MSKIAFLKMIFYRLLFGISYINNTKGFIAQDYSRLFKKKKKKTFLWL